MVKFRSRIMIELDSCNRLTTDEHQFILERRNPGCKQWIHTRFYGTIANALSDIAERWLRASEAKSISELIRNAQEINNRLERLVSGNWDAVHVPR